MHNISSNHSSYLASAPVMAAYCVLGVLAAVFGQRKLSALFLFVFLLAAAARAWANAAGHRVVFRVSSNLRGVFPGEDLTIDLEVHNEKFLPVTWMELFCPLHPRLCLTPEDCREPDAWELQELKDAGAATDLIGEKQFPPLLWYERTRFTSRWKANCRGVYSMSGWRFRTGDGFGMVQVESALSKEDIRQFTVYPALVPVSPELFLRNLWNADTGTHGILEDPTVIRSTRDYQTGDSLKHINWRLAARGLPLAVNVYEDILPKSVHFLLDGESFSGPEKHPEALEETLSILASEFLQLAERQVQCGLSICTCGSGQAVNRFHTDSPEELLQLLAGYEPLPDRWDESHQHLLPHPTRFDALPILDAAQRIGRFYYIAYNTSSLPQQALLRQLEPSRLSILTYEEQRPFGLFETVCLQQLRKGERNA